MCSLRFTTCALFFVLLFAGCTAVPSLDAATGNISIPDVVTRLKCELVFAFQDRRFARFLWLRDWTVKADLTLQANEQGGITPNGSDTYFRKSAINTAAGPTSFPGATLGTFQQFFTFGASGGVNAQAVRTELLSFSLSLKELADWQTENKGRLKKICAEDERRGLVGNLGLREWIEAALSPAIGGELLLGHHPAPSTSKPAANPSIVAAPSIPKGLFAQQWLTPPALPPETEWEQLANKWLSDITDANNSAQTNSDKAVRSGHSTTSAADKIGKQLASLDSLEQQYSRQIATARILKELADDRDLLADIQTKASTDKTNAEVAAQGATIEAANTKAELANAQNAKKALDQAQGTEQRRFQMVRIYTYHEEALEAERHSRDQVADGARAEAHVKDLVDSAMMISFSPDPPIDSLGHSVQFVVAYGGSISPSWTLIQWRGPSLTGPLISASGTRTHILQLALASPGPTAKSGNEQNRIIQNFTYRGN
jgi:hypothetical protein